MKSPANKGDTMIDSTTAQHPAPRYLREDDILARFPFSRTTLWRLSRSGRFPAPVKITSRFIAWIAAEVDEWEAKIAAERNERPAA